jgi:hypothetical protein
MNIAQVLKAEISRISKHEAKLLTSTTRSTAIQLKKTTADLKNRLSILEKSNKELQKQVESLVAAIPKPVETQEELGKLTNVSLGGVRGWERQQGMLKLKDASKKAIMAVRGIGKVEARKRLDELGKTITLDKNHKNPYLKLKKLNVIAKKKALTVVKKAVKRAGLKRRK